MRSIAKAGVDAVIVQDVGLVNLIRKTAPGLAIHGSTQMSITSPEGAEFARELGCKRVVVGRELSVREIAAGFGVPGPLVLDPRGDHRMAFAFALLGLFRPGAQTRDPDCVAKSWPGFWEDLAKLGASVVENP